MASRRIAQSSVNWAALAERVPQSQKPNLAAFKSMSDKYLRSVIVNPETPPKIDWAHYQKSVPIAGMVDKFQKAYEALQIPYPADTVTAQVEAQEKQVKEEIAKFCKDSESRIADYASQIAALKALLPYDQMTMEDYRDAFPDQALDPINRPTFWPHSPEEQEIGAPNAEPHH
ncbi:ATP synthase D chain [Culex quinquefasciatus]|uniref:ATP synthase subunit d, mitochondrial n=1 Tax=Culex quinquefasciatus TaxID=7176 RepID=B0WW90_CULQU|nr:ATP synthase subunit d, mitochondrial-like [Culex pipiens pallens]EDS35922.1 ATP synthase D chain [Culex quinquefasciatus]|eukprot:XP_001861662.1 ATP synthase D chain [Culex quinquefasciatus]